MTRRVAPLVGLLLVAVACGQKPGVADQPIPPQPVVLALPAGATVDPATGQVVDAQGNVIGDASDFGAADVSAGEAGVSASDAEQTSTSTTATSGSPRVTTGDAPTGGDTTGVTEDVIKIGAHAPLTGAAPVPSDSAQKGVELLWEWLEENNETLNGRRVEVVLKNDYYNPSSAIAACKEMVEKDKVFMLFGFAGTDQIQACARYAASVGVPYVSVGASETGLTTYPNYFAVSLSYAEQGLMLADYLTGRLGAARERNGMLRFDTPNFQDARDAFAAAMGKKGLALAYDRGVSKAAGTSEARTVVQEMKTAGIENVYVLTSPVWFIQVLQAAQSQQYHPQWVGVGMTKALDTVASVGCRNGTLDGAKFFSPFPAWADIDRFDPEFKEAVQAVYQDKGGGDDIMVLAWGMSKAVAALLDAPGPNLTRERFVYFAERTRSSAGGVFPPMRFEPDDHFGGTQVHVNEAQCSGSKNGDNRWHTIQSFVSDF